jgi:hypothetical protein
MMRLRIRSKILLPLFGGIFCLVFSFFVIRTALLHPEEINVKDDYGAWRKQTPTSIRNERYFSLGLGLIFGLAGFCAIGSTFRGYIFRVSGESFFQEFDAFNVNTMLVVGPFTGLEKKGLAISIRYAAPWVKALGSFRIWPATPMMTYHAQLFGRGNGCEALIAERTFKHEEEGGENGKYKPEWVEEIFSVQQEFSEYYFYLAMRSDDNKKLIWPKPPEKAPVTDEISPPTVRLWLDFSVALRWQDLKAWRENPNFDLKLAQVQLLESDAKPFTQAVSATARF